MKKIVIDVMGSDNGPESLIEGAIAAAKANPDYRFVCVGEKTILEKEGLASDPSFELLYSDDVIGCDEPAMSTFKGRDSASMVMALKKLKEDEKCVGLLSAGNTGALMVGSIFRLGMKEGYKSPALASLLPNLVGRRTALVDCGANVNPEAKDFVNFAVLGSELVSKMYSLPSPTVALLNVGKEEGKGTPLILETYNLLKEAGERGEINFIGNAEGYDIVTGYADVVVCDGYAGNLVLKVTEAVGKTAISVVNSLGDANTSGKILEKLTDLFVLNERGGATFLGCIKPVIKMHGCAKEETVSACVEQLLTVSK